MRKNITLLSIVLATSLFLTACQAEIPKNEIDLTAEANQDYSFDTYTELPNSDDALGFLEHNFPSREFTLLREIDNTQDENYIAIYDPNMTYVFDSAGTEVQVFVEYDEFVDEEGLYKVNFLTDIHRVLAEQIAAENNIDSLVIKEEVASAVPSLRAYIQNRDEIAPSIESMQADIELMQTEFPELAINMEFYSTVDGLDDFAYFSGRHNLDRTTPEEIEEAVNIQRAKFIFTNNIEQDEYTTDEIQQLLGQTLDNYGFRILRSIDEELDAIYWEDLGDDGIAASSLSVSTMYEVLNRLGMSSLSGDADHFSFTGANGADYEFSKDFRSDEDYRGDEFLGKTFTYLKDGVETEFFQYNFASITYTEFEQMTGLFIRKYWAQPGNGTIPAE